jgi:4-hydroxy-4-methyl-2-oxoglutarate aldolase
MNQINGTPLMQTGQTTQSVIDFLKSVDAPTLSNAIEGLKIRPQREGFVPLQVRALFPEFGRMVGYAVTAHVETITEMQPFDREGFVQLYRAVEQSPKPAVIAFQEIGGYPDYAAHCGEVMASIFTRMGAIGLVSDCGVRDIPEVKRLGFHYFARGSVVSHANFRIVRVSVPIQVQGMVVKPGDILHGDDNGVLQIPPDCLDRLPAAVEGIRSREKALLDFVRSDRFSVDGFANFVVE